MGGQVWYESRKCEQRGKRFSLGLNNTVGKKWSGGLWSPGALPLRATFFNTYLYFSFVDSVYVCSFLGMGTGINVIGKLEAGKLHSGDKVVVMPAGCQGLVKGE